MATTGELAAAMGGKTPTKASSVEAATPRKPPPARKTPEKPAVNEVQDTVEKLAEAGKPQPVVDKPDDDAAPSNLPAVVETDVEAAPSASAPVVEDPPTHSAGITLPPVGAQGDLVQARVQPPSVGELTNRLLTDVAYAFGISKGQALGAVLLVALNNHGQLAEILEVWAGQPADRRQKLLWEATKEDLAERFPSA